MRLVDGLLAVLEREAFGIAQSIVVVVVVVVVTARGIVLIGIRLAAILNLCVIGLSFITIVTPVDARLRRRRGPWLLRALDRLLAGGLDARQAGRRLESLAPTDGRT